MTFGLFNRWMAHCKDVSRVKRLDRWYRKTLKKRSYADFVAHWERQEVRVDYELIKKIADVMELPNYYIYPHDRSSVLFVNCYADMRETEAIMILADYGITDLDVESVYAQYRYAKDWACAAKCMPEPGGKAYGVADMLLSVHADAEGKSALVHFDMQGKSFLQEKLRSVLQEKDHEFFVLGAWLGEYGGVDEPYRICDFLNVAYDEGEAEMEITPHCQAARAAAVALRLTSRNITDLLRLLETMGGDCREIRMELPCSSDKASMCALRFILA